MRLYLDGTLIATKAHSVGGAIVADSSHTVTIGDSIAGSRPFDGVIDDVRVYSQTLTDTEVVELYGLVGHWTFDEGTGTTIADLSPNANDASFNTGSPNWVTGVRGTALEFDGSSDAVTSANFTPPNVGTVVMWWRSDGPPASRQRPWGSGGNFEMWQDPDGLVSMDVNTDGFQGGFITTEPLYASGRWYHIAAVFDSDDDSYEIYIDGVLHRSGTSTWDITPDSANLLSFGTRTGSTQRFTGAIDDFRIYSYKLSAAQIANSTDSFCTCPSTSNLLATPLMALQHPTFPESETTGHTTVPVFPATFLPIQRKRVSNSMIRPKCGYHTMIL